MKLTSVLNFIRGIVRPAVTLASVGAAIYCVVAQIPMTDWFDKLLTIIVTFYFVDRIVRKNGS